MMRWFWILLVLLAVPVTVSAQNTSAWEVVLYGEQGEGSARSGEFVVLTPNGITARYPVPTQVYANSEGNFTDLTISPDRHYAAFAFYSGSGTGIPPIAILDLSTGACCTYARAPIN